MDILHYLGIDDPSEFKVHAARYNQQDAPLDVFLEDRDAWHGWNCWFGGRHDFNRPYVLALMDYYPEPGAWLFGGIYRIENYHTKPDASQIGKHSYEAVLTDRASDLIGRLKLNWTVSRGRSFKLETMAPRMSLIEILRQPYTGPTFPGYDAATLTMTELRSIIQNNRTDWKTALSNMKGIYVLRFADGRLYVGSACGASGIWSRWCDYAATGHGGNAALRELHRETGGVAMDDAQVTLLEAWPTRTEDRIVLERETYWKRALHSREFGMNRN